MTQHDDLEVLGPSRAYGEPDQGGNEAVDEARHNRSAWGAFPLINPHDLTCV